MSISIKSNLDGITGAIQVNGADVIGLDTTGITSIKLNGSEGVIGQTLISQGVGEVPIWANATTRVFSYENRSALRALNPFENDQVIVESLGLFIWKSNSTELDDDESCFATASGRWLLEMPHWDLIEAWQLVDREAASNLVGSATFQNAITSVGAGSKIFVNVYVPGATVNDIAVVNFNDNSYSGAPGMLYGVVTDLNKVTVYFCGIGIANGVTSFPTGTYRVTVIKS